jgi:hypothetical protein
MPRLRGLIYDACTAAAALAVLLLTLLCLGMLTGCAGDPAARGDLARAAGSATGFAAAFSPEVAAARRVAIGVYCGASTETQRRRVREAARLGETEIVCVPAGSADPR